MKQFYLEKLKVENFRNISSEVVEFSNGINCIFGENGNGKTNLLEAVSYLLNRKSFRKKTSFPQMISVECEQAEIIFSSVFKDSLNKKISYSGKISNSESQWFTNSNLNKKKIELKTILINPFDSFLFHTTSSFRRGWFDTHLSDLSGEYKRALKLFNTSLKFRNNLLSKKPFNYMEQIKANNYQLSLYSYNVLEMRKAFLKQLEEYCMLTFQIIFDESHTLEIEIKSSFNNLNQEEIFNFYEQNNERDSIIGHTKTGVHRDDYIFILDGYNSYEYCSLGQQKMSFLSLLFAYIELFRYKLGIYPVVLIDDVSGELDEERWKNLINYLEAKKFQVLITTANKNFKKELEKIKNAKKIFISNGSTGNN